MKCCHCKKAIASGVEATKMILQYRQDDGTLVFFGYGMEAGPLEEATGRIHQAWHHKCFHIVRKRESRGDAVTGRVLAGAPSAYEMSTLMLTREEAHALGLSEQDIQRRTGYLTNRLQHLRTLACSIGKGVGDPTVLEAFWAQENGGVYEHWHQMRQEMYQLRAHLQYAHGLDLTDISGGLHAHHDALHAAQAIHTAREQDPDDHVNRDSDWRTQHTAEIDQINRKAQP